MASFVRHFDVVEKTDSADGAIVLIVRDGTTDTIFVSTNI